jgi:1-acyl-sn-glycerol-3-phosphate acyltransferase
MRSKSSRREHPTASVAPIDLQVVRRSCRVIRPLAKHYFRAEVRGLERLPAGQSVLVGHHDGGVLPMNGIVFANAWYEHYGFARPLYVLSHDFLHQFGARARRLLLDSGVIPAGRDHMDAALATGASVLVFPGAARETFRPFWRRRDIDLGGRTGFVAQAIRWKLPITPIVAAGSHETLFVLADGKRFAKAIGLRQLVRSADVWPVMAGLPWGLWALPFLPQWPLPAKITVEVLEPIHLEDVLGQRLARVDAGDPVLVRHAFDAVLARMRAAIDRLHDERRWPVLG